MPLKDVADIDFDFENSPIMVSVLKDIRQVKGLTALAPAKAGQMIQMPYWAAVELARAGFVKIPDEAALTYNVLSKIHWRENASAATGQPAAIPKNFYCLLRRYLAELRGLAGKDPVKYRELSRAEALVAEIVNGRIRKVLALAASPVSDKVAENLTYEESALYLMLTDAVGKLKAALLEAGKT